MVAREWPQLYHTRVLWLTQQGAPLLSTDEKPMDFSVSNLILSLYQGSKSIDDLGFQDWAIRKAQEVINFEACQWAEGRLHPSLGPQIHKIFLFNQPYKKIKNYQNFIDAHPEDDQIALACAAAPGKAISWRDVTGSDSSLWSMPLYLEYAHLYGEEHLIATAIPNLNSDLFSVISFYRSDRKNPFTDREKQIKEVIAPHMVEAYRICTKLRVFGQEIDKDQKAVGLIDKFGTVHTQTKNFRSVLNKMFETPSISKKGIIPRKALNLIHKGSDSYHNKVRLTSKLMPNGLYLVVLHDDPLLRELTPREADVLILYRQGNTYKAISEILNISTHTVSQHLRSIRNKLGVKRLREIRQNHVEET